MAQHTPLYDCEKESGATFSEYSGWLMPSQYGDVRQEYEAARHGVAVVDRCNLGKLKLLGKDGLDLLNRLSTFGLMGLKPGMGAGGSRNWNKKSGKRNRHGRKNS